MREDFMKEYIISHFDEALEKGYIKVYFQPVVRTLTGKVCDMEALSRWVDPEHGMIQPDLFIPVLEENDQVHRLDLYVIKSVIQQIHKGFRNGMQMAPISVNLSRRDFELIDIYEEVRREAAKGDFSVDSIRFEVTETALTKNENIVMDTVRKLHEDGYQVWLDDFGSGYSSLNVLTRYAIDELKVDREFLRNFGDADRTMVTSIIQMAKSLGIHTLVEGVETAEQVEFLRSIGCEKIQGYYYSEPLPIEEVDRKIANKILVPESPEERKLLEEAGWVDFVTDTPTAVVMDDEKEATILAGNEAYHRTLAKAETHSIDQANLNLRSMSPYMRRKFRELLNRVNENKDSESLTYVDGGQYFRTVFTEICGVDGLHIHKQELANISPEEDSTVGGAEFDVMVRHLASLYDEIYHINSKTNTVDIIQTETGRFRVGQRFDGAMHFALMCVDNVVYPDDRERFVEMISNIENRMPTYGDDERRTDESLFRMLDKDGDYRWRAMSIITFIKNGYANRMICIRDAFLEGIKDKTTLLRLLGASYGVGQMDSEEIPLATGQLWDTLVSSTDLKVFWKDRDRRFVGASKAFLDFYGFKNIEQILGKTDAEIGWHVDDTNARDDELDVIEKGYVVRDRVIECIVKGREHRISPSKFPVYKDGKIVGLMGFFTDLETRTDATYHRDDLGLVDEKTGLLSFRGMLMSGMDYEKNYRNTGEEFCGAVVNVPEYIRDKKIYGEDVAEVLFQKILNYIQKNNIVSGTLARIGECNFLYLLKGESPEKVRVRMERLAKDIRGIKSADGYSVDLQAPYAVVSISEVLNFDEMLQLLMERHREAERLHLGDPLHFTDRIVLNRDRFEELNMDVYVADPDTYEIVYGNRHLLESRDYPKDYNYRGRKCYEIVANRKMPCEECNNRNLHDRKMHSIKFHDRRTDEDFLAWNVFTPWEDKEFRLSFALRLSEYGLVYGENTEQGRQDSIINDAITLAMEEQDVNVGVSRLMERMGSFLRADRFLIFEEKMNGTISCTYEWDNSEVKPCREVLQEIPIYDVKALYDEFEKDRVFLTNDIEYFRDAHPDLAKHIPGVKGVAATQMMQSHKSMGYIMVVNPDLSESQDISAALEILSGFLATLLRDKENKEELLRIGSTDPLTGVQNRHALYEFQEKLVEGLGYTFIFADINGLKEANDTYGHETGDKLICDAADAMKQIFGEKRVFRLGGDEFMMIAVVGNQGDAEVLVSRLRQELEERSVSVSLGYTMRIAPIHDFEAVVKETDALMYEEKNEFYKEHDRRKRRD